MTGREDLVQSIGMTIASSLNFFGAIAALVVNPDNRNNPFFYTAMTTSFLYIMSNGYKTYQLCTARLEPVELREIKVDTFAKRIEAERKEKVNAR